MGRQVFSKGLRCGTGKIERIYGRPRETVINSDAILQVGVVSGNRPKFCHVCHVCHVSIFQSEK